MVNATLQEQPLPALFDTPGDRIYPEGDQSAANGQLRDKEGQPRKEGKPWLFSREKAQRAAQLSAEARRLRKHLASLPPPLPPKPSDEALLTQKRLEQLSKQIARTIKTLDEEDQPIECPHCKEVIESGRIIPKDRAQLLNALDRLLERERILRGIAAPAPFRAPRQTRQSSQSNIEPL